MWIWDSSWSSSCFLIKKEQNQKEYLLITKRIYLLPRQRLEKKSIYCKCFLQVCRFQAINRGCYNSHTHKKNIHCVASNSFWWIRHWFCWMLGELWILNILSGTDTSCIPQLVWNLSRWAEPKPQGALGNPLRLEWGGLCCVGWHEYSKQNSSISCRKWKSLTSEKTLKLDHLFSPQSWRIP